MNNRSLRGRFFGLFLLYFISALVARLLALSHWQGGQTWPSIEGVYADALIAMAFAGLTALVSYWGRWIFMIPLLLWWVLLSTNLELIVALNDTVDWYDFTFLLDPVVVMGSLQKGGEFTGYLLLFLAILIAAGFALRKSPDVQGRQLIVISLLTIASLLLSWVQTSRSASWHESSPIARTMASWQSGPQEQGLISLNSPALRSELAGGKLRQLQRPEGLKPNVLLIVLEGIPGIYVPQIANHMNMDSPVKLESLEMFARDALYIPNMVAHKRQTIRGLYALLCGDYSKLKSSTPKAYEYIEKTVDTPRCLPSFLNDAGYESHFLQAAPLAVMSKDQFMPAVGFDVVLGTPYFENRYLESFWGVDDRAFFEGAAAYIDSLRTSESSWFLTLLTVGTHHPYGVPPEMVEEYGDAKVAAVAYLDQALVPFLDFLKESGVYEDTLVIITSDESHGVSSTILGNNWGLGLVRGPGIGSGIIPEVYGLLDWPLTIVDYLNLSDRDFGFIGRSVFREYPDPRQLLFTSDRYWLAEGRQRIIGCTISLTSCSEFRGENGELFSTRYKRRLLKEEDSDLYLPLMRSLIHTADTSLFGRDNQVSQYSFIENKEYSLSSGYASLLSGWQYLTLPADKPAILELDIENIGDLQRGKVELELKIWTYENDEDVWKLIADQKRPMLPLLRRNEHLTMQYLINPQEEVNKVNFDLRAIASGGDVDFRVNRYTLTFPDHAQWEKSTTGITTRNARIVSLENEKPMRFVNSRPEIIDALGAGWGQPESWGVWSIAESARLIFGWKKTETIEAPCVRIDVKPYISESHPSMDIHLRLNERSLGKFSYLFGEEYRPILAPLEAGWLKDGENSIQFDIDSPISPLELGRANDRRRLGIGLKSLMVFQDQAGKCSS